MARSVYANGNPSCHQKLPCGAVQERRKGPWVGCPWAFPVEKEDDRPRSTGQASIRVFASPQALVLSWEQALAQLWAPPPWARCAFRSGLRRFGGRGRLMNRLRPGCFGSGVGFLASGAFILGSALGLGSGLGSGALRGAGRGAGGSLGSALERSPRSGLGAVLASGFETAVRGSGLLSGFRWLWVWPWFSPGLVQSGSAQFGPWCAIRVWLPSFLVRSGLLILPEARILAWTRPG